MQAAPLELPLVRRLALAVVGALVLVPVILWIVGGGVGDLARPTTMITSVGGLAGALGSASLLVFVLATARIPVVEVAFGTRRLAAWATTAGAASMGMIAAHVFLAVAASALTAEDSVFEAAVRLAGSSASTGAAVVGLTVLGAVLVTARRRRSGPLEPRGNRVLRVWGLLGIGLALPHQLLAGSTLGGSFVGAMFWWLAWLAAVAAIVVFRIWQPLAQSTRHQLTVDSVEQAPGGLLLHLSGMRLEELLPVAGARVDLRIVGEGGPAATRMGAITGSGRSRAGSPTLEVLVPAGDPKRASAPRPGSWVLLDGPSGAFSPVLRGNRRVVVLAAGPSVAPAAALLGAMTWESGEAALVHRVSDRARTPFRERIAELVEGRGLRVVTVAGPRARNRESWLPEDAALRVTDHHGLTHLVPDIAERDVFVHGPSAWVDLTVKAVEQAGVPNEQIHAESFPDAG